MTTSDRLKNLANALTEATTAGRVSWTPADDETFSTETKSGAVEISTLYNKSFTLTVYGKAGQRIETMTRNRSTSGPGTLQLLYEAARENALKIGEVVDSIIRDVSE